MKAKEEFKCYYDHRHTLAPDIKVGNKVWLNTLDICTTHPLVKLTHCQLGPFEVTQVVGKGAFKLALPPALPGFTLYFRL